MPRARISATGAMPDPSFRFEPGQCSTFTRRSASSALFGVGHPHAVRGAQPLGGEARRDARYAMLSRPVCARTTSTSSRCSDACVWTSRPRSSESAAVASSRSRVHEIANRGASAARSRPSAAPCQRAMQRQALVERGSRVGWQQPRRRVAAHVHQALADDGAQPGRHERLEHRVRVVHRLHRQHGRRAAEQQLGGGEPRGGARASRRRAPPRAARRARAATRAAAGRRRGRETASGTDECASARSRAARAPPPASIDRRGAPASGGAAPTPRCARPAIHTSPVTTSHASFIVRMVRVADEE